MVGADASSSRADQFDLTEQSSVLASLQDYRRESLLKSGLINGAMVLLQIH
jgi:hypothetical protein